jgi:hypothetical protein
MSYKILDSQWRSARHFVGFIAYDCQNPVKPGEWNSVVGYRPEDIVQSVNLDEDADSSWDELQARGDEQYITACGAKLEWEIAHILFPQLNIKNHKYYDGE